MKANYIYGKLPLSIQTALINIQGLRIQRRRFNKNFWIYLQNFNESNPDAPDLRSLKSFLNQALRSKFWKERFIHYSINPEVDEKQLLLEIQKLPILTKEEVKKFKKDIIVEGLSQRRFNISTSGSTGSSLTFPQTVEMENKQWAVWWRYRGRFGLTPNHWMGWFGGKNIVPNNQETPPFWRVNYPGKQLMFSPIHLNRDTAGLYYNEIIKRNITWLHGYPSQLASLAGYISELELPPIEKVTNITTGAEGLMEHQKEIIFNAFKVRPLEHYGLAEGVANVSQLPDGSYSIDQDFAFVELIPLEEDSRYCRIIGTNYNNPAFPLIRYDTGDIAEVKYGEGGEKEIINIEGRQEDYLILGNGNRFGPMNQIFKNFRNIKEAQVFYRTVNDIELRIVKDVNFEVIRDEKIIFKALKERLTDNSVKFRIVYMDKVERTKTGKIKAVIKG